MDETRGWGGKDSREFLDAAGTLGAGAAVFTDGVRYVDDIEFWRWFTADVVKAPAVGGEALELTNSDAVRTWVESRIGTGREGGLQTLFRGRSFEYDFVRSHQHDPLEFLRGNLWRRGTVAEDPQGIDAVRRNIFSGETETHQLKHALSDGGARVNLSRYGPEGRQPVDVVEVNERIADWRSSPAGRQTIAARGDAHPDVRIGGSDQDLLANGDERLRQAAAGEAAGSVTFEGALNQAGRGAMIGAVVGVGLSGALNFGLYRRGEISGAEFGDRLIADSGRSALLGGAVAVVNMPVQLASHALGVGSPVTVPVMLVIGAGIRHLVQPMFRGGAYADALADLEKTTDLAAGIAAFAGSCHSLFEAQRPFLQEMARLQRRASALNALSRDSDQLLVDAIDQI